MFTVYYCLFSTDISYFFGLVIKISCDTILQSFVKYFNGLTKTQSRAIQIICDTLGEEVHKVSREVFYRFKSLVLVLEKTARLAVKRPSLSNYSSNLQPRCLINFLIYQMGRGSEKWHENVTYYLNGPLAQKRMMCVISKYMTIIEPMNIQSNKNNWLNQARPNMMIHLLPLYANLLIIINMKHESLLF